MNDEENYAQEREEYNNELHDILAQLSQVRSGITSLQTWNSTVTKDECATLDTTWDTIADVMYELDKLCDEGRKYFTRIV